MSRSSPAGLLRGGYVLRPLQHRGPRSCRPRRPQSPRRGSSALGLPASQHMPVLMMMAGWARPGKVGIFGRCQPPESSKAHVHDEPRPVPRPTSPRRRGGWTGSHLPGDDRPPRRAQLPLPLGQRGRSCPAQDGGHGAGPRPPAAHMGGHRLERSRIRPPPDSAPARHGPRQRPPAAPPRGSPPRPSPRTAAPLRAGRRPSRRGNPPSRRRIGARCTRPGRPRGSSWRCAPGSHGRG